jgi:hypothetical protein
MRRKAANGVRSAFAEANGVQPCDLSAHKTQTSVKKREMREGIVPTSARRP